MSIMKSVVEFSVAPRCVMGEPCEHDCVIVFSDKKKLNVTLGGEQVLYLINNLPQSTKIKSIWGEDHFAKYSKEPVGLVKEKVDRVLAEYLK
ncbi:MAG: hypothetical protein WCG10_00400 [Chlamydiota bacterium]